MGVPVWRQRWHSFPAADLTTGRGEEQKSGRNETVEKQDKCKTKRSMKKNKKKKEIF